MIPAPRIDTHAPSRPVNRSASLPFAARGTVRAPSRILLRVASSLSVMLLACGGSASGDGTGEASAGAAGSLSGGGSGGSAGGAGGSSSGAGGSAGDAGVAGSAAAGGGQDAGVACAGDAFPCAAGCGSDWFPEQATCERGRWTCPPGTVDPRSCPTGTCWGPPLPGETCGPNGWECRPSVDDVRACPELLCATCEGFDRAVSTTSCTCTCEGSEVRCLPAANAPCEQVPSPCACFVRPDCSALTDTCLCSCDYLCPGEPPCDCDCGGGQYLGCAANTDGGG